MLDKEYAFYQQNKDELKKKYLGKYIVIKGGLVLGAYNSNVEAVKESLKMEEMGTFLVQEVVSDDDLLVHRFHSRVVVRG